MHLGILKKLKNRGFSVEKVNEYLIDKGVLERICEVVSRKVVLNPKQKMYLNSNFLKKVFDLK